MFHMESCKFYFLPIKKENRMKKIALTILFSLVLVQARTWNTFTSMECDAFYAFIHDSLAQINFIQGGPEFGFSVKCIENGFDDTFPITDSIGNIVDWEEKRVPVTGFSIHFFNESNPTEDSLWARHLNTWDTFDTIDVKDYVLFNNDSISFDSIYRKDLQSSSNFLILYKGVNYNAFCHVKSGLCTGKYSIFCQYQDDGSLNFDTIPNIPSDCNYLNKIVSTRYKKNVKMQNYIPCKVDGTIIDKSSSTIIIKNNQPTLQLKRKSLK